MACRCTGYFTAFCYMPSVAISRGRCNPGLIVVGPIVVVPAPLAARPPRQQVLVVPRGAVDAGRVLVEEEGGGEHDVRRDQHEALEPVAAPIGHDGGGAEHAEDEYARLEWEEVEGQGGAHRARGHHAEGYDEEGDLRRRSDRDPDGELHLVLHREDDCGGVLCGVAHDGQQDGRHEGYWKLQRLRGDLDRVDHQREECQPEDRPTEAQHLLLVVIAVVVAILVVVARLGGRRGAVQPLVIEEALLRRGCPRRRPATAAASAAGCGRRALRAVGFEEEAVRLELEDEECRVDDEQHDRAEAGEAEGVVAVEHGVGAVEQIGHEQSDHAEHEQRGVGLDTVDREGLHLVAQTAEEERRTQHEQQVGEHRAEE
eukprot:scaffold29961_cov65-Phaeocystis_antarctica.AAC.5